MRNAETVSHTHKVSLRTAALITGVAYLLNPVLFAEAYAMPHLVASDSAQTVANMAMHPHLFSSAILCYFGGALMDLVIAWSLYLLLAPVHRAIALLGSLLQVGFAVVWLAALSNLGLLYRLVCIPAYSRQISAAELPVRAVELVGGFRSGWGLGLILFGLHLAVTGWLLARSSYLPRWMGWLLFADGLVWVADSLCVYVSPDATIGWLKVCFVAEWIFMIWLLGWGWRMRAPDRPTRQA